MRLLLKRELLQLGRQLHDKTCMIPYRVIFHLGNCQVFLGRTDLFCNFQKLILLMRFFGSDICARGSYLRDNYFTQVDSYTKNPALFHRGVMCLLGLVWVFLGRIDFFPNFSETYSFEVPFRVGYFWMGLLLKREILFIGRQLQNKTCYIPQRVISLLGIILGLSGSNYFPLISQKILHSMRFFRSVIWGWGS